MELATLPRPAAETLETSVDEPAIAWIADGQSGDRIPVTAAAATIHYYESGDNDHVRRLSCLCIEDATDEPRRFWLPLATLQELEERGVHAEAKQAATEDALERYLAAQLIYTESGPPEIHW